MRRIKSAMSCIPGVGGKANAGNAVKGGYPETERTYMQMGANATSKEEVRRVEARRINRPKELRKSPGLFIFRLDTGRAEKKKKNRDGERRKRMTEKGGK